MYLYLKQLSYDKHTTYIAAWHIKSLMKFFKCNIQEMTLVVY